MRDFTAHLIDHNRYAVAPFLEEKASKKFTNTRKSIALTRVLAQGFVGARRRTAGQAIKRLD